MRVVGYAALVLVAVFGVFVVWLLVRSWRDTYGDASGAGSADDDQG